MEDSNALEYNTARPTMHIPEYGRNVQKMIDHAVSLADRDERNKVAQAIIKVMGELNPQLRDVEEYKPKLWTHLFIMSNFELDVDSPYPIPKQESLAAKPEKVDYPQSRIKIGHYGKTIEKLIDKAKEMTDEKEKEAMVKTIASMMKRFHLMYNSNTIEDSIISSHLEKLSDGELTIDDLSFLPSTNEILKSTGGVVNKQRSGKRKNKNNNRKRKRSK